MTPYDSSDDYTFDDDQLIEDEGGTYGTTKLPNLSSEIPSFQCTVRELDMYIRSCDPEKYQQIVATASKIRRKYGHLPSNLLTAAAQAHCITIQGDKSQNIQALAFAYCIQQIQSSDDREA